MLRRAACADNERRSANMPCRSQLYTSVGARRDWEWLHGGSAMDTAGTSGSKRCLLTHPSCGAGSLLIRWLGHTGCQWCGCHFPGIERKLHMVRSIRHAGDTSTPAV